MSLFLIALWLVIIAVAAMLVISLPAPTYRRTVARRERELQRKKKPGHRKTKVYRRPDGSFTDINVDDIERLREDPLKDD